MKWFRHYSTRTRTGGILCQKTGGGKGGGDGSLQWPAVDRRMRKRDVHVRWQFLIYCGLLHEVQTGHAGTNAQTQTARHCSWRTPTHTHRERVDTLHSTTTRWGPYIERQGLYKETQGARTICNQVNIDPRLFNDLLFQLLSFHYEILNKRYTIDQKGQIAPKRHQETRRVSVYRLERPKKKKRKRKKKRKKEIAAGRPCQSVDSCRGIEWNYRGLC